MNTTLELAGDHRSCETKRHKSKEKHRAKEELTPTSPMHLVRPEKVQRRRAVMAARARARGDPVCALMAARARIMELGDKRGPAGLV